jgi:hypothetical protein
MNEFISGNEMNDIARITTERLFQLNSITMVNVWTSPTNLVWKTSKGRRSKAEREKSMPGERIADGLGWKGKGKGEDL